MNKVLFLLKKKKKKLIIIIIIIIIIIKPKPKKKLSPNCTACLVLTTWSVDKLTSLARRDTKVDYLNASP